MEIQCRKSKRVSCWVKRGTQVSQSKNQPVILALEERNGRVSRTTGGNRIATGIVNAASLSGLLRGGGGGG